MATQAQNHPNAGAAEPASLEYQLAKALGALRGLADDCGDDDYYEAKAKAMLDRRPLILLAVATPGQVALWALEPGHGADTAGVLYARVVSLRGQERPAGDFVTTEIALKGHLLTTIEDHVSWLRQELTGEFLTDDRPA